MSLGLFLCNAGGEPGVLLDLIPGLDGLGHALGHTWMFGKPVSFVHVALSLVSLLLLFVLMGAAAGKFRPIPDNRLTPRTFFEIVLDALMDLMSEQMGRKRAERYLPLVGSIALFIFFSNVLALIPGLAPPTDNLNVNVGLALIVFIVSNAAGIMEHVFGPYMAHFFGPIRKWYALPLMLLLFPIEIIGQLARPLSLSMRLMGNMFGDHATMAILLGMFPFFLPIPMLFMGLIVVIIQTVVFTLLSIVYISMAVESH